MPVFNDKLHKIVKSEDGSFTAYSKEYDEHYHSTKDGALNESFLKHVKPAFLFCKNKNEVNILDICFGLGFNTLSTLYFVKSNNINKKIHIYSPELDVSLLKSLKDFQYPKEFNEFECIILKLIQDGVYDDGFWHVEIFKGDARKYIKTFPHAKFDIIYQDAFSPNANPALWTKEYFADIRNIIKNDGVLTTYSTALKTRLALYENGFGVYLNKGDGFRNATIASPSELSLFEKVDMEHKINCNPHARPLRD